MRVLQSRKAVFMALSAIGMVGSTMSPAASHAVGSPSTVVEREPGDSFAPVLYLAQSQVESGYGGKLSKQRPAVPPQQQPQGPPIKNGAPVAPKGGSAARS
jgi:hypothetical protein